MIPSVTRNDRRTSATLKLQHLSLASSITHNLRYSEINHHEPETQAAADQQYKGFLCADRRLPLKNEGGSAPAASSHSPSASSKHCIRLQPAYRCSMFTLHFLSGPQTLPAPALPPKRGRYIILTARTRQSRRILTRSRNDEKRSGRRRSSLTQQRQAVRQQQLKYDTFTLRLNGFLFSVTRPGVPRLQHTHKPEET